MRDADIDMRGDEPHEAKGGAAASAEEKTPTMATEWDLQHVKHGTAILATCLVQTLNESDPSFQERFLRRLTEAQYEVRDNSEGEVKHELELLSWTRRLLTGWDWIEGQGKPFLGR